MLFFAHRLRPTDERVSQTKSVSLQGTLVQPKNVAVCDWGSPLLPRILLRS